MKSCLDVLLTPITNIVNLSLESGSFPDVLKVSRITPLLKKPSLSKDDMKNYRPVSNLNFISKIIDLDKNNLSNPNQSAYKPLHTHIFLSLSKTDPEMSLSLVQQCLQDASDWMIASKLKLHPDKTEFILIGPKSQRDKFKKYFSTKLLDQDVTPTVSAQNLGVEFDKDFNFKKI